MVNVLGNVEAIFGPSLDDFVLLWFTLAAVGNFDAILGLSLGVLGTTWAHLGAILGHVGVMLGLSSGLLGLRHQSIHQTSKSTDFIEMLKSLSRCPCRARMQHQQNIDVIGH